MSLPAIVLRAVYDAIEEETGTKLTKRQMAYLRTVLRPYLRHLYSLEARIYWEERLRKRPPPLYFWRRKRRRRVLWWLLFYDLI